MTNTSKVENVPVVSTTAMDSDEIRGLYTSLNIVEPSVKRLNDAVKAGKETETALLRYREQITKDRATNKMFDEMLKAHPEYISAEESRIVEGSRKAVTAEIEALNGQIATIQSLLQQTRTKYGIAPVTVKQADKKATKGTANRITEENMPALEEKLKARGFLPSFSPLGDGTFLCVDTAGSGRTGRYYRKIEEDWV
jgi:Fe-S cluster assembly scaffold protein SufB